METALQRPELMPHKPGRLALGIGASIVAHAILLLAYRIEALPGISPKEAPPVESLVILVKPTPPEPPPVIARAEPVKTPAAPQPAIRTKEKAEEADKSVAETVIAVEPTPAPAPDPFYVQPAPQDKPFDIAAARAAARSIATSPDPARAALPVSQFDRARDRVKPQLTKSERAIANAARRDCKDGLPGGLLGPIIILFDKKDHGCKW